MHFRNGRQIIGQLPDLRAAGFCLLQVRKSLLSACPFRHDLLERAANAGFGLVVHLDDMDDVFFLDQLDSWIPSHLTQCIIHAEVDDPTFSRQLSLLCRGVASHGLALSIENVHGCTNAEAIARLLSAEPTIGFCLDVGHARRAQFPLSAELTARVRLIHLHGTDAAGNDHKSPNDDDFLFIESLEDVRGNPPVVLEVNDNLEELCRIGEAARLALRALQIKRPE